MESTVTESRSFSSKPDFDECMARIYAWYEQRIIDRPPVRFHHHNVEYERHRTVEGPWRSAEERWLDVEFQVNAFVDSLGHTPFLGETFPVYWPNLSAVVYNLFLGQRATFDDMTAWTHPWVDDLDDPPELNVQRDGVYFRAIEAMTRRALELAEGRFLVGFTDMYAGVDCAMGLRGMEQLCVDLVERPESVKRLIERAFAEYPRVYRHFDEMLKAHGQPSVTWMNLPSTEAFNVLACDFATNISREHFDEFCMPILRREAELFRHNVFHMDGPGVARHLDSILTLSNTVAIQWVQGYGEYRPIMQWIPLIKQIQEAGKSVIVDLSLKELDGLTAALDPTGVMLWIPAEPRDQPEVLARVKRWRSRGRSPLRGPHHPRMAQSRVGGGKETGV